MQAREIVEEYRPAKVLKTSPWSTVFLAADPRIGDEVVLKLIAPASPVAGDEAVSRFLRTIEAVRSLPGASIPPVRDLGVTPDQNVFLVMDAVGGVSLEEWPRPRPAKAISVLLQTLGALEVLTSADVSHLNLRSDNILVSVQGHAERVRLLGFGTAAFLAGAVGGVWPDPGTSELAPELFPSAAVARAEGWRSDLFSLAAIACRLLGAEAKGAASRSPKVLLGEAAADDLANSEALISMLEQALNFDPMARGDSLAEARNALIGALPLEPAGHEAIDILDLAERSPYETFRVEQGGDLVISRATEPGTPSLGISRVSGFEDEEPTAADSAVPEIVSHQMPDHSRTDGEEPVPVSELSPSSAVAPPLPPEDEQGAGEDAGPVMEAATGQQTREPSVVPLTAEAGAGRDARRPAVPRVALLAMTAVAAVVLLVVVTLILQRSGSTPPPETAARPTLIPTSVPTPEPELPPPRNPGLENAQKLLMEGDIAGSRAAIEALQPGEIEAFSEDEESVYREVRNALEGADRERSIRDLRGGLKEGSIRMLRRGVAGVSAFASNERRSVPGLERDLARGRDALAAHEELWAAQEAGESLQVINYAAALSSLLPDYSAAYQLREQAAVAIRADAEDAIEAGDCERAIALLDGLQGAWPGLPGVEERIGWCREQISAEQRQNETLDQALAMGKAGDPEAGLRVLKAAEPDPDWRPRYEEGRRRLEAQLANLDAGYPIIELPDGFELAFRKNATLVVPLVVTDDYRVERVVALVKTASHPEYREIQLQNVGGGSYPFEVSPELHDNQWVQFYVVAIDFSGHETRLGGPQGPLTIQRKRWFQK